MEGPVPPGYNGAGMENWFDLDVDPAHVAREAGIPTEECSLVDGSGLSTADVISPRAATRLLAYMYSSPLRAVWLPLLAAGGEDGTLQDRFKDAPAGRRRKRTAVRALRAIKLLNQAPQMPAAEVTAPPGEVVPVAGGS